ncbi:MAG: methyltransferase domain-containing protein [Acidimicrobiia bacterium]|nr:methyltransferase domain-containing protein [Acidimicrobiia bacterium]
METEFARQYYEAARADHWWFRGRKELIGELLKRSSEDGGGRVVDLGAGSDTLFPEGFDVVKIDIVRPEGELGRFVRASAMNLPFRDCSFQGAGAFDVIEHVAEAEKLLGELRRVIRPGGFVLATVPAHQWLWSPHDTNVGHVRRYEIGELAEVFEEAEFDVVWCGTFYGFLILPALVRRVLGLATDMGDPPAPLNRLLTGFALRSVRSALRGRRPGLSIAQAAVTRPPSN